MDKSQYESILDSAIQNEIDAQHFYAEAVDRMKDVSLQLLFRQLFEEEVRHQKILEGYKARGDGHLHFKRVPD